MIKELILRRRKQILVHSCIYYRLNESLITDSKFDEWAYELVELQKENPEEANSLPYTKAFEGFDGSTGFNLPYGEPEIVSVALRLINYKNNRRNYKYGTI